MYNFTLRAAVAVTIGAAGLNAAHAVTLTFENSKEHIFISDLFDDYSESCASFIAGKEFKILPTIQKDMVRGGERWTFDNDTNQMISVTNTATTPGASAAYVYTSGGGGVMLGSAAPNGDLATDSGSDLFGDPFGFLAPTKGSAAGNLYGVGKIDIIDDENFTVFFPVLEAQIRGTFLTLGQDSGGITMTGIIDPNDNSFVLFGEELIDFKEDVGTLGLRGSTVQWLYSGRFSDVAVDPIPIPTAIWLFGSGLLGLLGLAHGRK